MGKEGEGAGERPAGRWRESHLTSLLRGTVLDLGLGNMEGKLEILLNPGGRPSASQTL